MKTPLIIPESLKAEHDELHTFLKIFLKSSGKTGQAAKRLSELLQPHFIKEEKFALPPLSLLAPLARGKASDEMRFVIADVEQFKKELPAMLYEHNEIITALEELENVSKKENYPEATAFAKKLMTHARLEEEIIYPAAILVGEYLKLKLNESQIPVKAL